MPIGEFSLYYGDFTDMAGEGHWLGLPPSERVREGTTVPTDDDELLRLLDNYAADVRQYARDPSIQQARLMDASRAALLTHIAAHYVRRDSGH
jgi:hypothetical protein